MIEAEAGQLSVRPLGLVLTESQPIRIFTVRNPGNQPVTVQLQTLTWGQDRGADKLAPTRELLITPPIFTLPPAESQIVRIGLRRAPDPTRELSYRVRFSEVPPPPEPGFTGLVVTIDISVPVFVQPSAPAGAEARWSARVNRDGGLELTVANLGNAHLKLTEIGLLSRGREIGRRQQLLYVLPGITRRLSVPLTEAVSSGASLDIEAHTPAGVREFSVVVD